MVDRDSENLVVRQCTSPLKWRCISLPPTVESGLFGILKLDSLGTGQKPRWQSQVYVCELWSMCCAVCDVCGVQCCVAASDFEKWHFDACAE